MFKHKISIFVISLFLVLAFSACQNKTVVNPELPEAQVAQNNNSGQPDKPDGQTVASNDNKSSNIEISNWQTYHNEELGFEVMYPGDFFSYSHNDKQTICFGQDVETCSFSLGLYGDLKKFDKDKVLFPIPREALIFDTRVIGSNDQYNADVVKIDYQNNEDANVQAEVFFVEENNELYYLRYNKINSFTIQDFDSVLQSFKLN